jgi:large subunit ribosomal protein L30e
MADLSRDIRLAVDSGEVAIGAESVMHSIKNGTSKLVIVASAGKKELSEDIVHMAKLSDIKVEVFDGNSMDLGTVCGKPFSVSALSILSAGNSNILKADYSKAEAEKEEKEKVEDDESAASTADNETIDAEQESTPTPTDEES